MALLPRKTDPPDPAAPQATLQEMHSWMRSVDQTVRSLTARLDALERRLGDQSYAGPTMKGQPAPAEPTVLRIQSDKGSKELAEKVESLRREMEADRLRLREFETRAVDGGDGALSAGLEELQARVKELGGLQAEVEKLGGKYGQLRNEMEVLVDRLQVRSAEAGVPSPLAAMDLKGLEERLSKVERRKAPVVQVGKVEIPVEFSGLVGGLLAIGLAVAVHLRYITRENSLQWWVFAGVGVVLLLSVVLKVALQMREAKRDAAAMQPR